MAIHHAADLIDHEDSADDLHVLKAQVAQQSQHSRGSESEDSQPVTMHDVVNLLWKYSTDNGQATKQKDSNGKTKVYYQLMNSRMHPHHAHVDYVDSLHFNYGADRLDDDGQYPVGDGQSAGTMESLGSWFLTEERQSDGIVDSDHILWTVLGFNIDIIVIVTCLAFLCCKCLCGFGVFKVVKSWIDHRRKQTESQLLRETDSESNQTCSAPE